MKLSVSGFAVAAVFGLVASSLGATAAYAEGSEDPDPATVISQIVPDALASAAPLTATTDGLTAHARDSEVTISDREDALIQLATGRADITVEIDSAMLGGSLTEESGVATFAHADGDASVVNLNDDGSLRITSVLQSDNSQGSFAYTYTGVELVLFDDGGVVGYDDTGAVQLVIDLPWAYDSSGAPVPTWYELDGNVLTQVVDHSSGSFQYPIVADPTNYGGNTMYKKISAATDPEGGDKVSVTVGTYNFSRTSDSAIWASYKSLVPAKYESETMRKQLLCHARNIGALKNPWNLETRRPNVSYAEFVLKLCNPN
ncbi:DUF2599 domain-containing protein [Microbacterium sp.]|uniref:DUF2599 domain-containing protein n=1 Tax=Microbacterium sp. TaxID=51671 RepID=UPI0039E72B73